MDTPQAPTTETTKSKTAVRIYLALSLGLILGFVAVLVYIFGTTPKQ